MKKEIYVNSNCVECGIELVDKNTKKYTISMFSNPFQLVIVCIKCGRINTYVDGDKIKKIYFKILKVLSKQNIDK